VVVLPSCVIDKRRLIASFSLASQSQPAVFNTHMRVTSFQHAAKVATHTVNVLGVSARHVI
jgi:hypothetical protein